MKKIIPIIFLFVLLLSIYFLLNIYHQENVLFDKLTLNNIEFTLKEESDYEGYKELIYFSENYQLTIYKKKGWVAPKGEPFSQQMINLFKNIKEKNKRYDVLSDYYHHIFVIDNAVSEKELDMMFNDYATKIYCKTNKNLKLHPNTLYKLPLSKKTQL